MTLRELPADVGAPWLVRPSDRLTLGPSPWDVSRLRLAASRVVDRV